MYFLDILKDSNIQYEYRTMAAFVLTVTMEKNIKAHQTHPTPVSYTHLTLPTICSV